MSDKKSTVADVALLAGVSKATVSNYLNKKFEAISEETTKKIAKAIEELGYVCNKNYHRIKSTKQIGLIVSDLTDPFISNLCKGVNDATTKHGYGLLIANSDNNSSIEKKYIQSLIDKAEGLIINTCGMDKETITLLSESVPVVLVDRIIDDDSFDVITSNNFDAMTELIQYLYDSGYTDFGLFTEYLIHGSARSVRCDAFKKFSEKHNQECNFEIFQSSLYDDSLVLSQVKNFLKKTTDKKRVIIGVNGRTTLIVISALTELDKKIPQDVGVCGFDDFDWASILKGGVTTVQQPTYDIGYEAVERLFRRINKENLPPKQIRLHSRLILRSSV